MAGYTAFVDESGDDGFNFEGGSTDFIVVAAIISRTSNLDQFGDALRKARGKARKSTGWVFPTFKKLNNAPVQRWLLADQFSCLAVQTCCVLIHKRGLSEPGWQSRKEDMYFHASKFLIERISWACRDTDAKKAEVDPVCNIIFSRRGGLRYEKLQTYVRRLQSSPQEYDTKAEWRHIDPNLITCEDHSDSNACHLAADHFASAVGCAVELKDYYSFDDRYARIWTKKIYSYKGRIEGNGLKIWPESGTSYLRADPRGFWIFAKV